MAGKLVSSNEAIAGSLKEQAAAFRQLASALHRAELAGDWGAVAAVRGELAAVALGLDEMARGHGGGT